MHVYRFFGFLILTVAGLSCVKKNVSVPDTLIKDLGFTQTLSPDSVQRFSSITSYVKITGPNQCYKLSGVEVYQNGLQFDIRAKANIPNPDKNPVNCDPSTYIKDTTITIETHLTGKHVLRFMNGTQVFKVDTVKVY